MFCHFKSEGRSQDILPEHISDIQQSGTGVLVKLVLTAYKATLISGFLASSTWLINTLLPMKPFHLLSH